MVSLARLAVGCSLVLLVGCGPGGGQKKITPTGDATAPTGKEITLHVPEMRERLRLT